MTEPSNSETISLERYLSYWVAGYRRAPGKDSSTYSTMNSDSRIIFPSWSSTGTLPWGFRARNQSSLELLRSIGKSWKGNAKAKKKKERKTEQWK